MIGYIRIFVCVTAVTFLAISNAYSAPALPHKVLTIEAPKGGGESKKTSPLQFELQETDNGLKLSVRFSGGKEKKANEFPDGQVGGDYMVFLDEIIVINEPYKGSSLNVSRDVPLTTLQNGKHSMRCELRAPSGEVFKSKINFIFDGSPAISVTEAVVDKFGILDPSVRIDFLGDDKGTSGFADIFLDERPYVSVPIKKEHAGKKIPLSQITGKPLSTATLVPGTHLLMLRMRGISGIATVSYSSFAVNTSPELKIIQDKNNIFQEVIATFIKPPEGYSGFVDVFYDQNVILSKQDKGTLISIKRAEIVEGLKKNNHGHLDASIPLVISLRAANGSENWLKIDFK
ncbi:MAG: hypothetical protein HY881_14550 [Deltaproteobacteria bacterium]|nr:hypothetical protein [Deltaproteobacteria bacterium]